MAKVLTEREKYGFEQLLGLTGSYDKKSLRKAYLAQVQEWHPDHAAVNGHSAEEATAQTKLINEAFVQLSGLLGSASARVQCSPAPSASSAGTAGAAASAGAATDAGSASYGTTYEPAHEPAYEPAYAATDPTPSWEDAKRAERNREAARRYTRIVTDPRYMRAFVTGIGPHVVWALLSLLVTGFIGLGFGAVYGATSFISTFELLVFPVAYDLVTGKGAELVGSMADVWAVNRAVRGVR